MLVALFIFAKYPYVKFFAALSRYDCCYHPQITRINDKFQFFLLVYLHDHMKIHTCMLWLPSWSYPEFLSGKQPSPVSE